MIKFALLPAFAAGTLVAVLLQPASTPQEGPSPQDMAAMMAKAKKWTQPGKHHELLKTFIGTWSWEGRMFMAGREMPAGKGTSQVSWLIDGRFVKSEDSGIMMGQPSKVVSIMGYDNFKHSYVMTFMSSMETAMRHAEGDMDPGGKVLLAYGTLDEYLTGEHDKMVKYVWRLESKDRFVLEVHDLPIGEKNTKVLEFVYKRKS